MRVSVTINDDMNNKFTELAQKQAISKDKFIGAILIDWFDSLDGSDNGYVKDLEEKVARLEQQIGEITKHNARGAGRKRSITPEEIEHIKKLHTNGMSLRAIGREVGYSVTHVMNIIKGGSSDG